MFYERKGQAIITNAVDVMWDATTFYEIDGMLTDDEYTYGETFMHGAEDRWNDEIIDAIVRRYGCELRGKEIVYKILNDNIDEAVMAMIQATTAAETCLYYMRKKTEG